MAECECRKATFGSTRCEDCGHDLACPMHMAHRRPEIPETYANCDVVACAAGSTLRETIDSAMRQLAAKELENRALLTKLADAERDRDEWREKHAAQARLNCAFVEQNAKLISRNTALGDGWKSELEGKLAQAERVVAAAVEWRELDESEPIGSGAPNEALKRLAFRVDDFNARRAKGEQSIMNEPVAISQTDQLLSGTEQQAEARLEQVDKRIATLSDELKPLVEERDKLRSLLKFLKTRVEK